YSHDPNADARPLVGRFDDKRGWYRIALDQYCAIGDHPLYNRKPGIAEHRLRGWLVHRYRGGENARMGIRNPQHIEYALHGAVFPPDAVQCVEDYVGARIQRPNQGWQITADIDEPHLVTAVDQSLGAFASARQRHLALGRPSAHHDRYGLRHRSLPFWMLTAK